MGRPRKEPADRRTVSLSCRLTPAERLAIEQAALRAGLSASDYVRRLALTGRMVIRENRSLDYAAFDQVRRIGVNLNQLARIANHTGRLPAGLAEAVSVVQRFIVRELGGDRARDDGDGA
jgi:uncharacterized protein (DUF1778 family)